MPDLFENPMGLDGFEFVEFSAREPGVLEGVFELHEEQRDGQELERKRVAHH